jgi:hypothetical protein
MATRYAIGFDCTTIKIPSTILDSTIGLTCLSLIVVLENILLVVSLETTVNYTCIEVKTRIVPLGSSKPFATLEKILVP